MLALITKVDALFVPPITTPITDGYTEAVDEVVVSDKSLIVLLLISNVPAEVVTIKTPAKETLPAGSLPPSILYAPVLAVEISFILLF